MGFFLCLVPSGGRHAILDGVCRSAAGGRVLGLLLVFVNIYGRVPLVQGQGTFKPFVALLNVRLFPLHILDVTVRVVTLA